jgi:putative integral membrane protein (TIGR02587 family)
MPNRGQRPIVQSLQEYGRGIAGGLLFSLPLVYTMEVWWTGFIADSTRLLLAVIITFGLLLGYNRFGGMRPGVRLLDVIVDSVEEMGMGTVLAALILFLLGRITAGMTWQEILGKVVVESLVVSIGVSVGTAQLGMSEKKDEGGESSGGSQSGQESSSGPSQVLGQMVLAFCGAVLFAANIAPTEEIVIVAIEASTWKLLGLAALSLLIGMLILHFSDFVGARHAIASKSKGAVLKLLESVAGYAIALLASAMMLWFFRRFDGMPLATCLSEIVVLGLAANIGASAGRLLIQ